MANYTLIYLLNDNDYTFFNLDTDGVQKAVINKIGAQIYVDSDKVDTFVEDMLKHFAGYLIPSEYTGEIVLSEDIMNNYHLLPEYPSDFDWDLVAKYLPKYHQRQDVADNDDFQRYVDRELLKGENDGIIDECEANCPDYLTKMQWVEHQLAESDTALFIEAMENK